MPEKQVEHGRSAYVTGTCHMRKAWENESRVRSKYETKGGGSL